MRVSQSHGSAAFAEVNNFLAMDLALAQQVEHARPVWFESISNL